MNMQPLELLNFAISSLHVDFVESPKAKAPRGEQIGMNFEIHFGQHATTKRQYRVEIQSSISEVTPGIGPLGFQVKATIVGIVKVRDDVPDGDVLGLVQVGSVNVLYGTLRGVIACATGVFPTGPLILRSLTPADIIGVKLEQGGVSAKTPEKLEDNQDAKPKSVVRAARKRRSPAQDGVASAQRVFTKVLAKADPKAVKK